MWIAKIRFSGKGTLIGSLTTKYKINLFGFPLSYYYEKENVIVNIAGTLFGEKENIKEFSQELKKQKRVVNFELNNDFFVGTIKEPIYAKEIYNKNIIHVTPALISDKGYEIINIGCFKKENLMKAFQKIKRNLRGELLSIQKKKIKTLSIMKINPDLTDKQRDAMKLAIKHGYYNSPRKTSVQELARIANLSFSTFQVHLRKAEEKAIPYFFE